jgi:hypothetical protein
MFKLLIALMFCFMSASLEAQGVPPPPPPPPIPPPVLGLPDVQEVTGQPPTPTYPHPIGKTPSGKAVVHEECNVDRSVCKPYQTWSLFLLCNRQWRTEGQAEALHDAFLRFGEQIGNGNLAVWFWKEPPQQTSLTFDQNLDIDRNSDYCRLFKLDVNSGPYVVVTNQYPDLLTPPQQRAVVTMPISPASVRDLLDSLAQKIHSGGYSDSNRRSLPWWVGLLIAAQQSLHDVGCAVSFKLETGSATTEIHPCKSTT